MSEICYGSSERGFSLIELLVTVAILGILASLGITSFSVYKDNAEYARGQVTLRNARVAISEGEMELPPGHFLPLTFTADAGGPMPAVMAAVLPGAQTPRDLRLGALYDSCEAGDPPMQINQLLVSTPCKSTRRIQWMRFCNGTEILLEALPGGCP